VDGVCTDYFLALFSAFLSPSALFLARCVSSSDRFGCSTEITPRGVCIAEGALEVRPIIDLHLPLCLMPLQQGDWLRKLEPEPPCARARQRVGMKRQTQPPPHLYERLGESID
jgi:hypothetical protein